MPIYYPDGNYPLPVHGHIVLDIDVNAGQSDMWVRNLSAHHGGNYDISIDHGLITPHALIAGAAVNYDSFGNAAHYHVTNTGTVALQISVS